MSQLNSNENDERNGSRQITNENNPFISQSTVLQLQSLVDDIPFQLNPKYRSFIVPDIDIPENDYTEQLYRILLKKIDFKLESQVFSATLDNLRCKKKNVESEISHTYSKHISAMFDSGDQLSDSFSHSPDIAPVHHHQSPLSNGILSPNVNNSSSFQIHSLASSIRLSSVRDLKWPSDISEECNSSLFQHEVKKSTHALNTPNYTTYSNDTGAI